jgi:hypothetical protein
VVIVKRGRWLYDGTVEMPVDIVGLPFDFWFEIGRSDEQLEPGETPQALGADGLLFYVRFRRAGETSTPTWPDSAGYATVDAAMKAAEERAPSTITWD